MDEGVFFVHAKIKLYLIIGYDDYN